MRRAPPAAHLILPLRNHGQRPAVTIFGSIRLGQVVVHAQGSAPLPPGGHVALTTASPGVDLRDFELELHVHDGAPHGG